ncbi:MAG: PHP domain-containing protein, partial [Brachybacterium tyrofermentans]
MAGWFLGPPAWKDIEAILSDRPAELVAPPIVIEHTGKVADDAYRPARTVDYAELHAHSHFSFLDGASSPEDMVEQAARLGLGAITLVDHDGLPGAVRFARAAGEAGIATVFGAELTLGLEPGADAASATPVVSAPRTGIPDPEGEHLLVLVRDTDGYRQLSAAIARAHLDSGEKAVPRYRLAELSRLAREGRWQILTGCRKGSVTRAAAAHLADGDLEAA